MYGPYYFHMWLLFFLCGYYCAWFQFWPKAYCYNLSKQGHRSLFEDTEQCCMCMNHEYINTLTKPGYWCSDYSYGVTAYVNATYNTTQHIYLGGYNSRSFWCYNYQFMPNATQAPVPQPTLLIGTKLSKKKADILVTLATSLFE